MPRWGIVIDLRNCIGCKTCTVACKETNQVPDRRLRQVEDCGISGPPNRERLFLPISCMHCKNPPCLAVCPTGATTQREDGIVEVSPEKCLGCGYCIVACPYQARAIYHQELESDNTSRTGTCIKCNFCLQRLEGGMEKGLRPGIDPQASPACVANCSGQALHFGDLDDPGSEISRLLREYPTERLLEKMDTQPSLYYILPPSWKGFPEKHDEEPRP